jgi:mycothiol synthase
MEALELDVVSTVDATIGDEVRALVARHETASGHPGLSEERLRVLERASRGDGSEILLGVTARRPGATGLVGWSQVDSTGSDRTPTLEAVALPELGTDGADALVDTLLSAVATIGTGRLRWWVGHASDADDARAATRGFIRERDLLQLRCPLPLATRSDGRSTSAPDTRAFQVGRDETAWLVQNNRAFADHPEQGNWGLATLMTREAEPWFDPDGFRILEVDGRIAGSCWTKVHRTTEPHLGEIYVIGVDPDFHGRGWGRALTEDGFGWLASAGLTVGMLYVDPDNTAALALYTSMGMTTHHVDRAYVTSKAVTGSSSDRSPA